MQALSAHYRVFAFDLWGYGDSSKISEKYTLASYVEMLEQFIERLGMMQPVTIVGHGLGAAVGLRYAIAAPDAVKRLTAVSLPIHGEYLNPRLTDSDSASFLNRILGRQDTHPEVESELRKIDNTAMNKVALELSSYDFAVDLDAVTCPVLLVFGDDDPVVQQPSGDYYHFQQSGNKRAYVSLQSCNHFPMLEETAKFNRLLLEFMRSDGDLTDLSPKEYWQRRTY